MRQVVLMLSDHGIGLGSASNCLVQQVVLDVGEGEVVRLDLLVRLLARRNQGISFISNCLLVGPLKLWLKLIFFTIKHSQTLISRDSSESSALSSGLSSKPNSPERPSPTLPRSPSSPTSSPTLPRGPAQELERGCGEQAVVSIKALCKIRYYRITF